MQKKYSFSITTSCFNCEEGARANDISSYLEDLYQSIINQTYEHWEWVVVDDYSTDETSKKLYEFTQRDSRIRFEPIEHKKQAWWNPQYRTKGHYFIPFGSDDILYPQALECINYFANYFPDAVMLQFGYSHHMLHMPKTKNDVLNHFDRNIYPSCEYTSFLDGFKRLRWGLPSMMGYPRVIKNIPGLHYNVHEEGTEHYPSDDAQHVLVSEECGKWITIPRVIASARKKKAASENVANWNVRGEAKLIDEAIERRKHINLEYPRSLDYFNNVFAIGESTYSSKLSFETEKKNITFMNFNCSIDEQKKIEVLFFNHNVSFNILNSQIDYCFYNVEVFQDLQKIEDLLNSGIEAEYMFFSVNSHLHLNSRTNRNHLEDLKDLITKLGLESFWHFGEQHENKFFLSCSTSKVVVEDPSPIEINTLDDSQEHVMRENLIEAYENTEVAGNQNEFLIKYSPNPRVDVIGSGKSEYKIHFRDADTNTVLYETTVTTGMFASCAIQYYVNWEIIIYKDGKYYKTFKLDLKGKKVSVLLDSKSLGDTLAWMPPLEEFQKKHQCELYAVTFHNHLYSRTYPTLKFLEPNEESGIILDHEYCIGFFEDGFKSPVNRLDVNLQEMAFTILGLEYKETKPRITLIERETELTKPYVAFGMQSTLQAKYWNNPNGWQEVVDYLHSIDYEVVCCDLMGSFGRGDLGWMNVAPENVIHRHDRTLQQTAATIQGADMFIGLGSGLSWLAWSLDVPVIMISGFSNPSSEFQSGNYRVAANNKYCRDCYNRVMIDAQDWLWCPDHKNTPRMFECSKNILSSEVIEQINKVKETL